MSRARSLGPPVASSAGKATNCFGTDVGCCKVAFHGHKCVTIRPMKRATPNFDRWLKIVARELAPRGVKAELARHLSEQYGRPPRSWETNLAQIVRRDLLANAEVLLAIDAWLAPRTGRKKRVGDTSSFLTNASRRTCSPRCY